MEWNCFVILTVISLLARNLRTFYKLNSYLDVLFCLSLFVLFFFFNLVSLLSHIDLQKLLLYSWYESVVGRLTTSKNVCIPVLGICEYVISQGKRDFVDMIKGKGLEMERLSCQAQSNHEFFKVEEEGRGRVRQTGRKRNLTQSWWLWRSKRRGGH